MLDLEALQDQIKAKIMKQGVAEKTVGAYLGKVAEIDELKGKILENTKPNVIK